MDESETQATHIQHHDYLGGHPAWEMMRSTNNPEVYKATTLAAKQRFSQRRDNEAVDSSDEEAHLNSREHQGTREIRNHNQEYSIVV